MDYIFREYITKVSSEAKVLKKQGMFVFGGSVDGINGRAKQGSFYSFFFLINYYHFFGFYNYFYLFIINYF